MRRPGVPEAQWWLSWAVSCAAPAGHSQPRGYTSFIHTLQLCFFMRCLFIQHTHTHTHTHTQPGIWKELRKGVRDEEEEEEGASKCLSILWFIHLLSAISEATAELSNQDCIVLQNKTLDERSWDGYYPHTWPLHESRLVTVRAECSCCRPVQGVSSE